MKKPQIVIHIKAGTEAQEIISSFTFEYKTMEDVSETVRRSFSIISTRGKIIAKQGELQLGFEVMQLPKGQRQNPEDYQIV